MKMEISESFSNNKQRRTRREKTVKNWTWH